MKVRKAIIPAAGLGTRVLPASKAVPKETLNIVDKPAIQYIVEEAAAAGIEDVLIVTNRGKGVIEDHFDRSFELEEKLGKDPSKAKIYEEIKSVSELANVFFIRQKETKGLAHAILRGKSFVGNEPFAVLYGDDVIISDDPVTSQLARCYEKYGKGVVGVKEVPKELIGLYCTLDVSPIEGEERTMRCRRIIEKPAPDEILSLYAILGRIVMPPEIFDMIEEGIAKTPVGKEFPLTDVFTRMGENGELLAYDFKGDRYDMGDKLGVMKANCEIALKHPEIGEKFGRYLKELVKTY